MNCTIKRLLDNTHTSLLIYITALMLTFPGLAASQELDSSRQLAVLLSTENGAPSADQVISYFDISPPSGTPPLDAFSEVPPDGAEYLLPLRASGDFLAYLNKNPEAARAKLERYLIVTYSETTDMDSALASLQEDINVAAVYNIDQSEFSSGGSAVGDRVLGFSQYGRDALNVEAAWQKAGGYALIGAVDTGLSTTHPALRQFSGIGQYLGGNFISASSLDIGSWPNIDFNIDEQEPVALPNGSACNPSNLPGILPAFAGHGTHVSGLIAANSNGILGVKGVCKNCGIAMWKITSHRCNAGTAQVLSELNPTAIPVAITLMTDSGVQVVNMSLGNNRGVGFCDQVPNDPYCLALTYSSQRQVMIFSSSGNDRSFLDFPANDARVSAVGGFDPTDNFWDESPGNNTNCPLFPSSAECGSNYTFNVNDAKQGFVGSAQDVLSTTYPGKNWNTTLSCGDGFGPGSGAGLCTGTSMSSPQIAGVAGLLRSVNALAPVGEYSVPFLGVPGVRTVMARTTKQAQLSQPWSSTFGHGQPDTAAAAKQMLGAVRGHTVNNRVTPLFRFYGSGSKDYLETSSPQMAVAFAINQANANTPQGSPVPGYLFPQNPNDTALPTPRANVYVLTTEYRPRSRMPNLIPLYLVERTRNFPIGCTVGSPGCNGGNRDFTLLTSTAEIEQAYADGYVLRTIQGYIYQSCAPEPSCVPSGAQKLYRECKTSDDDCAIFLEHERTAFESAGYTSAYPTGSSKVLGYAYPSIDTDNDGLVDGFEYVIGTRPTAGDSDSDGSSDSAEFPMTGIPTSDPCSGSGGSSCPADLIFEYDFDP